MRLFGKNVSWVSAVVYTVLALLLAGLVVKRSVVSSINNSSSYVVESAPGDMNLPNVPDYSVALPGLIRGAQISIDIETPYISQYADELLTPLERAAQRGVSVRILLNDDAESRAGVAASGLDKIQNISVRYLNMGTIPPNNRGALHSKLIVVDKKTALVGSANFSVPAMNNNREAGVAVADSRIVSELSQMFDNDWALGGVYVPAEATDFIARPTTGALQAELLESARGPLDQPAIAQIADVLPALISSATDSVCCEMYDLTWSSSFPVYYDAFMRARRSGASVELILDAKAHCFNSRAGSYNQTALQSLIDAGVKIYVVDFSRTFPANTAFYHAKTVIIDKRIAFISTGNLTASGMYDNREIAIMTADKIMVENLLDMFTRSLSSRFTAPYRPGQ